MDWWYIFNAYKNEMLGLFAITFTVVSFAITGIVGYALAINQHIHDEDYSLLKVVMSATASGLVVASVFVYANFFTGYEIDSKQYTLNDGITYVKSMQKVPDRMYKTYKVNLDTGKSIECMSKGDISKAEDISIVTHTVLNGSRNNRINDKYGSKEIYIIE